ncbi:MAG: hypothetical protein JNM36_08440 [Chitinophagales bacterium]|nr:hypothetical protein [Chitinophagales bacterium]
MNIYFLVEGKRIEMKVYPKWLSYLVPELQRSTTFDTVAQNNYFIFSGNGFPSLLNNHLRNCVIDINNAGNYDYFVICLDADEQSIDACKQEVLDFMAEENIALNPNTKFEIIVQNRCLETWFLANPKIFKKNPSNDFLRECVAFYNVKKEDPELMGKLPDFGDSVSVFHSSYLQELLAERNVSYSKRSPGTVTKEYFLQELILRNQKTNHIASFKNFVQFCEQTRKEI